MTDAGLGPQPAVVGVPFGASQPVSYMSPPAAAAWAESRWGLTINPAYGHVLAASMRLDEEGPFQGVKYDPTQERSWPRTFKYGWPNLIATPSAVMVTIEFGGAWYLNYEDVVPVQLLDWLVLQIYRNMTLPFDRAVVSESVTGASVHYAPPVSEKGGQMSELDTLQQTLIEPFLLRSGHSQPFIWFGNL